MLNRITPKHIEELIAASTVHDSKMGAKTTVVVLILPNGFEVVESSGCVDPANYDHDLGVATCMKRIRDKLWMLEGYLLQHTLNHTISATRIPDAIARVCYEVNRAYCQALGDDSQLAWVDALPWQRDSAIKGVLLHMEPTDHGPEASHAAWVAHMLAEGWTYGPTKDTEAKTHPCLVPFDKLPREQQAKDYIFRAIVHAMT